MNASNDKNGQLLGLIEGRKEEGREEEGWKGKVLATYDPPKGKTLSYPFYMGLSEEYLFNFEGKKRIMVIGREARGCEHERDNAEEKNQPENSQQWAIAYIKKQVYGKDVDLPKCYNKIEYNNSAFWLFFRLLKEEGFVPCWNNVDKVYFEKTGKLTESAEKVLSSAYTVGDEKQAKSLLVREIEIADPDIIIFVTGASYKVTMQTALKGEDVNFDMLPSFEKDGCLIKLGTVAGKPTYWINHPQGLFSKSFRRSDFEEYIIRKLKFDDEVNRLIEKYADVMEKLK